MQVQIIVHSFLRMFLYETVIDGVGLSASLLRSSGRQEDKDSKSLTGTIICTFEYCLFTKHILVVEGDAVRRNSIRKESVEIPQRGDGYKCESCAY